MHSKETFIQSLIDGGHLKTPRLIEAFRQIDRADFVLSEHKSEAYEDYPLPIGEGQTISQPQTVAFMLELLDPRPGEKILDIGAGSGWQTALLGHAICTLLSKVQMGRVVAMERIPSLCEFAKSNLEKYGFIGNGAVELYCRDATRAIPDGPYDKIIAAAAASKNIPRAWRASLKIGGRIVAPVGGSVWLFEKKSKTEWEEKKYAGFTFVPLVRESRIKNQESGAQHGKRNRRKLFPAFLLLASCFLLPASLLAYEIYLPHSAVAGVKEVSIDRGMGSRKIGALLKQAGVIRSKWAFVIYVSLASQATALKPGTYEFFGNSAIPAIAADLVRGASNERIIIIPEGWTSREIAAYFSSRGMFSEAEVRQAVEPPGEEITQRFTFLSDKPAQTGLEGYLFPDTYRVFRDAPLGQIIMKMLENFDHKVAPKLREEIRQQGRMIFEIITMASLIEKEVVSDEDRAIVSGILWKRLKAGIPLQADATIAYIKKANPRSGRGQEPIANGNRISIEDTKIDSPYNTYLYRGLPAGPIANPGLSAIQAAIYPKASPYLYYLSAPDGRTIFSRTLDDHNAAKAKYL